MWVVSYPCRCRCCVYCNQLSILQSSAESLGHNNFRVFLPTHAGTERLALKDSSQHGSQRWGLSRLRPASAHSNSVFHIHREWRSLSKAGAVDFMYHLRNCRRGHVLCSLLLQKQVRPFLQSAWSFFVFSVSSASRGILRKRARQSSADDSRLV